MKNSTMPPTTTAMAAQSSAWTLSLRNAQPMIAAQMGAVYCSRMALAAVVSLFAQTKPTMQAA